MHNRFVRVSPRDYKVALAQQKELELKNAVAKAAKSAANMALNVDETVRFSCRIFLLSIFLHVMPYLAR